MEYIRIGIGGQFNPDPNTLHFATVPVGEEQSAISYQQSVRREKARIFSG